MWKEIAIADYPTHLMSYLKNYSRGAEVVFCHAEVKRVLPQSGNQISKLII